MSSGLLSGADIVCTGDHSMLYKEISEYISHLIKNATDARASHPRVPRVSHTLQTCMRMDRTTSIIQCCSRRPGLDRRCPVDSGSVYMRYSMTTREVLRFPRKCL
jgi:hypothetical protein